MKKTSTCYHLSSTQSCKLPPQNCLAKMNIQCQKGHKKVMQGHGGGACTGWTGDTKTNIWGSTDIQSGASHLLGHFHPLKKLPQNNLYLHCVGDMDTIRIYSQIYVNYHEYHVNSTLPKQMRNQWKYWCGSKNGLNHTSTLFIIFIYSCLFLTLTAAAFQLPAEHTPPPTTTPFRTQFTLTSRGGMMS